MDLMAALTPVWVILAVTPGVLLYLYVTRNRNYWKNQNIRSEPFSIIFGATLKTFLNPVHEVDLARYRKYGKLFGAFEMGKALLFVAEPKLVKQVLIDDFTSLPNRRTLDMNEPLLDNMMSMASFEVWQKVRKGSAPAFSAKVLRKMNAFIEECALATTEHLKKAASNEEDIDVKQFFWDYALDVIAKCAFAMKLDSHSDPTNEFVTRSKQVLSQRFTPRLLVMKLAEDEALAQCIFFFLAGQQKAANAIGCTLYLLAIHQEVQDRLRKEVDECCAIHGDRPGLDAITNLKYLHCVVSETLRLYPPVTRLERAPSEDYTLGDTGVKVTKSDLVVVPVYAMQHDPQYFPEPYNFDPERFNDENVGSIQPYTYLPFGAGPRNCIAISFTLQAMKLAIFHAIRNVQVVRTANTKTLTFNDPVLDNMMSMAPFERWRKIRPPVEQAFSSENVQKMNALIEDCALVTADHIKKAALNEEDIDLKKFFGSYALDLIARCVFATRIDSHSDAKNEFVRRSRQAPSGRLTPRIFVYFLLPFIARATGLRPLSPSVLEYFRCLSRNVIKSTQQEDRQNESFLRLFLDHQEKCEKSTSSSSERDQQLFNLGSDMKTNTSLYSGGKLSEDQAMAQCLLFFIAGQETTARVIAYTLYLLAIHPDVQTKLRKEVDDCFATHGDHPDLEAITTLKYLHCVVSESLRMYPPVSRLERVPCCDYTLGKEGVKLKKGDLITVPVYAMHHDPDYFPDPFSFQPDRFSDQNVASIKPYTYLPFGGGPRNCVALRFALQAVKLSLLHTIHNVQVIRTEKTRVPLEFKNGFGLLTAKDIIVGTAEPARRDCVEGEVATGRLPQRSVAETMEPRVKAKRTLKVRDWGQWRHTRDFLGSIIPV
ncbi:hypothetical protein HPB50_021151 [Hyalomma asiaticum]|uniref:Uncharacterized protein n=1 Tax=Hyalomma asiaticum TaxID=266040 RepID=A0ACB7SE16_HYAAI|nr:hypothetical protein HPB50_021151 [Hyalomma asiaticum]